MEGQLDFPMGMSEAEVEAVVREVTDEEVAHYHEYGWVMMRGLVQPAFAAEMLRAVRAAGDFGSCPAKAGVEPFRSFIFSQRMSGNAAKLVNRSRLKGVDVPMHWRPGGISATGVSKPAGQSPSSEMPADLQHFGELGCLQAPFLTGQHSSHRWRCVPDENGVLLGSGFHSDSAEHGSDRVGELQFWLALAEVTPEMGKHPTFRSGRQDAW